VQESFYQEKSTEEIDCPHKPASRVVVVVVVVVVVLVVVVVVVVVD